MEFLRRYWTQIRAHLEGLSATQKGLVAALLVILLLVGYLLLQYAARPEMVAITPFSSSGGNQVLSRLQAAGIEAEQDNGQVMVPVNKRDEAIALLVQDNLLSKDASTAFNDLIANQSPWSTEAQDRRAFLVAKNDVLGNVLEKMQGVRAANVVIDMPEDQGFGQTQVKPSASVSVTMGGRERLGRDNVRAIAGLVSGAVAEMSPQDVVVIDAERGQQHTVDDPGSALPGKARELVRQIEERYKQRVSEFFRYIPEAIVAVSVQTSNVSQQTEREYEYSENEPLEREMQEETTRRDMAEGGEPGPRSNTGLDIEGGGGGGQYEEELRTESEFGEKPLVREVNKVLSGHQTQQINVAINIPRSYFADIYESENPDAGEPTNQDLQPVVEEQLQQIREQVEPLIAAEEPGQVRVAMYPDGSGPTRQTAMAGSAPGSVWGWGGSGWATTAAVAGLAVLSLLLMLGMVRKATKQQELPSVEELAGVPPTMPSDEEIVGEAAESEGGMPGVELDESQIQSRKVAEQISDMIKNNPSEAGGILGKWVDGDE